MHADSTTAVEVAISEALLNWPYFQDVSLVSGWVALWSGGCSRVRCSGAFGAGRLARNCRGYH